MSRSFIIPDNRRESILDWLELNHCMQRSDYQWFPCYLTTGSMSPAFRLDFFQDADVSAFLIKWGNFVDREY